MRPLFRYVSLSSATIALYCNPLAAETMQVDKLCFPEKASDILTLYIEKKCPTSDKGADSGNNYPPIDTSRSGFLFDFDSDNLTEATKKRLKEWVVALKELQAKNNMMFEIAGHTDNMGSDEYNLNLSQKRAQQVKEFLTERGVNPQLLESKGYGEKYPLRGLKERQNREERYWNRRVEFVAKPKNDN